MPLKISLFKLAILSILGILVLYPFFDFIISGDFIYFFVTLFLCLFLYVFDWLKIHSRDKAVVFLFLTIQFIDKIGNDILRGSFTLSPLFVFVFSFLFFLFLINIRPDKIFSFWRILRKLSFVLLLLFAGMYVLSLGRSMSTINREVSLVFFLYYVLVFYYKKKYRIPAFLFTFFFGFFVCENRTLLLAYVIFTLGNCIVSRLRPKTINFLIITIFFLSFLLISLAIYLELVYGQSYFEIFTGRGLLWSVYIGSILTSDSVCSFLLGMPSDLESIIRLFSNTTLLSDFPFMERTLLMGHPHNGLVYMIFNTGIIGIILLIIFVYKCFKRLQYNPYNFVLFSSVFVMFFFYGRSICSIYVPSVLVLISLLVPLNLNKK